MGSSPEAENRKRILKDLIDQLQNGVLPEEVKGKFKDILEGISALELELPADNPLNIMLEEHKILLERLEELKATVNTIRQAADIPYIIGNIVQLKRIAQDLMDADKHYLREENVLFPILRRHGITEPPAMMWTEHDQLRGKNRQLFNLIGYYKEISFQDFKHQLDEVAESLRDTLSSHIFKEDNILYPAAQRIMTDQEWEEARSEFDEIGYCSFTPKHPTEAPEAKGAGQHGLPVAPSAGESVRFEKEALSMVEIEAILNSLPMDITFVDETDVVRYFNEPMKRIFVRTKSIIGTRVQQCHPQKSVHIVNKILDSFRAGKRDMAEFWISMGDRLIQIRYYPVRDRDGRYLGTLEVTQDITDIKKLEGEKRLLDWRE